MQYINSYFFDCPVLNFRVRISVRFNITVRFRVSVRVKVKDRVREWYSV